MSTNQAPNIPYAAEVSQTTFLSLTSAGLDGQLYRRNHRNLHANNTETPKLGEIWLETCYYQLSAA